MSEEIKEPVVEVPEKQNQLKKIERDENGLIKGTNYIFDENGKVNWRKMINPEYLVPMKGVGETDITKLQDKDLLILLNGIKDLSDLRGYKSVTYKTITASPEYVCISCNIKWTPNFENEGREIEFESIGDASLNNTESFAKLYLGPIAENRAFVRCVRNFLRIAVLGKDEIGVSTNNHKDEEKKDTKQLKMFKDVMEKKKITWEHIKHKLKNEEKYKDRYSDDWKGAEDLPKDVMFDFLERMKKANLATT